MTQISGKVNYLGCTFDVSSEIDKLKKRISDDIEFCWKVMTENMPVFNDTTAEMFETYTVKEDDLDGKTVSSSFSEEYPEIFVYQVDVGEKLFRIFLHIHSAKVSLKALDDDLYSDYKNNNKNIVTCLDRVSYEELYKYINDVWNDECTPMLEKYISISNDDWANLLKSIK
jgi:L-cysteine desulfidase